MTARIITLPPTATLEDITAVRHNTGQSVVITVESGSLASVEIPAPTVADLLAMATVSVFRPADSGASLYVLQGADYTELMSAGPSWSVSKPANVFRIDDLWHYVDKYRAAAVPTAAAAPKPAPT